MDYKNTYKYEKEYSKEEKKRLNKKLREGVYGALENWHRNRKEDNGEVIVKFKKHKEGELI